MEKQKVIYGFWDRIEEAIFESGLSKCEIARKMGCERRVLITGQSEARMLSAHNLMEFCNVTGVSADYILGLSNDKKIHRRK